MNAIFVAFLLSSTAILTVILGVFSAYCAISAVLAVVNPAVPPAERLRAFRAFVPHHSQASGD